MRHPLLAAFVLVPSAAFAIAEAGQFFDARPAAQSGSNAPLARPCDEHCNPKWIDADLRINELQVVGTAESTKQRPDKALLGLIRLGGKKDAEALDFGQPSLAA